VEENPMSEPRHEDALVMLKCAELHNAMDLGTVANWIYGDDFPVDHEAFLAQYPRSSEEFGDLRRYVGYFETVGTLWKHGLFNEDLLLDWLLIPWDRLEGIVIGERKAAGVERLFENFEALGIRQRELTS